MVNLDILNLKPEEVSSIRKLYTEKKDTFEYLIKFGNTMERAKASIIKAVALAGETYIRQ